MVDLLLTRRAREDLANLPQSIREAAVETLTVLEADPERLGKELRGRLKGMWSCRVGNHRILYTIEGTRRRKVIVRSIRHRSVAYGRLKE